MNESSLGKTLGHVLSRTSRKESAASRGYIETQINLLIPPQNNPRHDFDQAALDELAESIRIYGMLQPIVVMRRDGGTYEILAGERRYRGSQNSWPEPGTSGHSRCAR